LSRAPDAAVENAKKVILDTLGVSILATSHEIGRTLIAFAEEDATKGTCTIWGTRRSASARDASLINGTLAHALDYDDRNHSSTYTLAASLAAGEQVEATGARVLEAFIVGREIRNCLDPLFASRSTGIGPGAKGWHSNGILGPIAAASAAGNVLALDLPQTTAAIGLAAGSCGALTRDGGTMAKPFRAGQAAANGVTCALLAKKDFSADPAALEARYGLLDAIGPLPPDLTASLAADLGMKFHLANEVKIKGHACCTASHSGLEAMLRLMEKQPLDPQTIRRIECDLRPYPLVRHTPTCGFEGRFSLPFCLAMTLINRRLAPDDFTDENVRSPLVQMLMGCTVHVPGAKQLIVTLINGGQFSENLLPPTNLTAWNDIEKKFRHCTGDLLGARQSALLIDAVHRLDSLASIRELTKLLAPPM
jgi:2-methylcitrate dehydratase PrpD